MSTFSEWVQEALVAATILVRTALFSGREFGSPRDIGPSHSRVPIHELCCLPLRVRDRGHQGSAYPKLREIGVQGAGLDPSSVEARAKVFGELGSAWWYQNPVDVYGLEKDLQDRGSKSTTRAGHDRCGTALAFGYARPHPRILAGFR